jgi:hypothetical protein
MNRLLLTPLLLLFACAPQSPTGETQEGLRSQYQTRDFVQTLANPWLDWVAVDDNSVYFLDNNHNLYLTDGAHPAVFEKAGVANIRSAGGQSLWIRDTSNRLLYWSPGDVFDIVRGSNVRDIEASGNVCLWRPFGSNDLFQSTEWSAQWSKIWSNVSSYKPLGLYAFIRDTSLNLYYYFISGTELVDGNVAAFDPVGNGTYVWVVGTDGKLWIERTGQGHGPNPVDSDVFNIQGMDSALVFVENRSGFLWREDGSWTARDSVDGNIHSFHATSPYTVWVEGSDGNLWREHLSTALP